MTHTIILDEAERDRRFVNHLNEILRHCRIGRVSMKLVSGRGYVLAPMPKRWMPDPMKSAPSPFFSGGFVPTSSSDGPPVIPSHGVMM